MNGIYYYLIAFVAIWVIALIFKKRIEKYGVDVKFPTLMWKTTRLTGFVKRLANISPRFWKWFMNVGIVVSFIGMVVILYFIITSLSTIATNPSVSIVIPGVQIPGSPIFVPFGYGIIGLATVLIIHEFSHGILAITEKINVKSIGLFMFAILPGAFVEPNDEELKKAPRTSRMRVFAAGSVANMSLALIAIVITLLISNVAITGTFQEDGVKINEVLDNSPSKNILESGMIIKAINGVNISDSEIYMNTLSNVKPNQNLDISTDQGNYIVKTGKNPQNSSRGYMGVMSSKNYQVKKSTTDIWGNQIPWIWFYLLELFQWIFMLNFSVGLFNLLPIRGLDGGHLLRDLLGWKLPEKYVNIFMNVISSLLIAIIVINIVYGFI
ncbi:site-2 protease family protein [Methanobrevibacter filiformis]|uniref:Peptidase family M50 n=1 Tax=Methanobrevibacter filiformis TaxID=55758 RepID=A0A166AG82_9EURY|nr:site-2 protease family protein [Methanobrevibacter filiformis]KZX11993.1 peptidase family M50 [Methanobrevibacter filiformis]